MTMQTRSFLKSSVLAVLGIGIWMVADSSHAACLVKPAPPDGIPTFMMAPKQEVPQYAALGFGLVTCPVDLSVVRDYVQQLCDGLPRRSGLPGIFAATLIGRPRDVACASARAGLVEAGG
jgi:hypothetical protein